MGLATFFDYVLLQWYVFDGGLRANGFVCVSHIGLVSYSCLAFRSLTVMIFWLCGRGIVEIKEVQSG